MGSRTATVGKLFEEEGDGAGKEGNKCNQAGDIACLRTTTKFLPSSLFRLMHKYYEDEPEDAGLIRSTPPTEEELRELSLFIAHSKADNVALRAEAALRTPQLGQPGQPPDPAAEATQPQ